MEKKKISLFGRFHNQKHLDDYVESLCYGDVKTGDIYILLGMFEQTIKEGFKDKRRD